MARNAGRLAAEIKQTRPFHSRRQEGAIGLIRTADIVRRGLAAVVEPHGLTLQQYNVLRILRGSGPEGLPTLEIADRMIESSPGITRLLDRLEEKNLIGRVHCPKDRRRVLCSVTPAGLGVLAALDDPVRAADEKVLGGLPRAEVETLIRLLDAIREGHGGG